MCMSPMRKYNVYRRVDMDFPRKTSDHIGIVLHKNCVHIKLKTLVLKAIGGLLIKIIHSGIDKETIIHK